MSNSFLPRNTWLRWPTRWPTCFSAPRKTNARPNPTTDTLMQISFCEWDNSALARHAAASLGRGEVQAWTATVPLDEPGLTTLTRPFSPEERQRAERLNDGVKEI